jgi:hypothetical protein
VIVKFVPSARWLTVPAVAVAVYAILTADPAVTAGRPPAGDETEIYDTCPDADLRAAHRRYVDRLETVTVRMQQKEQLIAELVAGRRRLTDVAAEFLRLNRAEPECLTAIRGYFPDGSDEEVAARNVIEYVGPRVAAGDRPAVLARLDREFAAAFGKPSGR